MEDDLLLVDEPPSTSFPVYTASGWEDIAWKPAVVELLQIPPHVPQEVMDLQLLEAHKHRLMD